ncbi:hypothetical protein Nepgr_018452 [Nepenthes gracilis]|uniref:Uncharacterized protein n=1 Tax=Nepenthes gracilis TaxID=150966 RepID=A0AAD3SUY9_NEPGR|nr:hypothetical protein Nepgr_018452 [Nepenthes gracilis]
MNNYCTAFSSPAQKGKTRPLEKDTDRRRIDVRLRVTRGVFVFITFLRNYCTIRRKEGNIVRSFLPEIIAQAFKLVSSFSIISKFSSLQE